MADRYWVGGSGNWDATSTANWAASSGGTAGASAPTSADNVIFDAASNVGTGAFTVTVTGTSSAPAACDNFSTGGAGGALDGAMTLAFGSTGFLACYGSLTLPATNLSVTGSGTSELQFASTATGKTITTNGVSIAGIITLRFVGVGGAWTLGSALTANALQIQAGTFDTGNYNLTINSIQRTTSTGTTTITLGSSAIACSGTGPINFANTTSLTLNANTSTITCSTTSPTFTGGGLTFYNVTFSSAASGTTTINGANTFNNLTQTSRNATGPRVFSLSANQTVSGTLTLGAANTAIRRIQVVSDTVGTQRTITLNGTLATLTDCDFRDIVAAGTAGTWTGTRIGNGLNNSGITFTVAKTVYWNLAGSQNWSATGWATTNNGVPAVNNFPLAQDTAVFTEAGAAGTVTLDANWWIGDIQMADGVSNRTTAFTLATGTLGTVRIYGNVTFFSSLTFTGTGTLSFFGYGKTQIITSAGISWPQSLTVTASTGTFQLADNLTNTGTAFTLTAGTLDLSSGNRTLTCVTFSSSNSNTRSISFGTGNVTVTGNNGTVLAIATATGFTYTGTPVFNMTYSGSTGSRTIQFGSTAGATESNVPSINISAGTDTLAMGSVWKNVNFSGFAGTLANNSRTIYGNLTISSGMTLTAGIAVTTFAATSGTQNITSAGQTMDFPVTINAPGATVSLVDALTLGSTRTLTLTAGTFTSNNKNVTTGAFSGSGSTTRTLTMGSSTWTITGAGTAWNTSTATNLTLNSGTSTITMTSSSAKTFNNAGVANYYILNQGGTGSLTIAAATTFYSITNTTQPAIIYFPASGTVTVTTLGIAGTSGNLVSLYSTTPGTVWTISSSTGTITATYADIKDSNATGGASWFAVSSTNGGNNTGWSFINPAFTTGNFLAFF